MTVVFFSMRMIAMRWTVFCVVFLFCLVFLFLFYHGGRLALFCNGLLMCFERVRLSVAFNVCVCVFFVFGLCATAGESWLRLWTAAVADTDTTAEFSQFYYLQI